MKYLVNFIHPQTILMTTVETNAMDDHLIAETGESLIAEFADAIIFEDIGFAPLQHCEEYTVEELN